MSDQAIIDVPTGFNGTEKITFGDVKPGDVLLDVFGGFTSPVKTVLKLKGGGVRLRFDYGWPQYASATEPCHRKLPLSKDEFAQVIVAIIDNN